MWGACPAAAASAAAVQGTPVQDSITNVWGSCFTDVKKCDFGMAISGHGLTCSGLNCEFEDSCEFQLVDLPLPLPPLPQLQPLPQLPPVPRLLPPPLHLLLVCLVVHWRLVGVASQH